MCGIYGVISKEPTNLSWCLQRLEMLEYRGYDSAGICAVCDKGFDIYKTIGYIKNLYKQVKNKKAKNVICHTRWATHGKINKENSHPHLCEDVCIVHNGIIDNYTSLRSEFGLKEKLLSDCDSEIISCLINRQILKYGRSVTNIIDALCLLDGSYALLIQDKENQQHIYGAKNKSPLYIGKTSNGYIFSSDLITFQGIANKYYELEDGEVFDATADEIVFYNLYKIKIQKQLKDFENIDFSSSLGEYSCFLEKEINDIPQALCNTYYNYYNSSNKLPCLTNYKTLHLIACGTAYHSALMGKYIIEKHLKLPCHCHIASEFLYQDCLEKNHALFIFISQSGETFDTLQCVKKANELGFDTLAITNTQHSQIIKLCDYFLPIYAGKEVSVASTKVYNCTILAFYYLCKIKNIQIDAKLISKIIKDNSEQALAHLMAQTEKVVFIGKCEDYVSAMEGSLKFRELTYKNSIAYPCGELKHGTLSIIDTNSLVIAVLTNIKYLQAISTALCEVRSRGGKTAIITSLNVHSEIADIVLHIEKSDAMPLELYSIIPMQKLALYSCQILHLDPDKPRNLAKSVTVQ